MVEGRPVIPPEEVPKLASLFGIPTEKLVISDLPAYEDLNFCLKTQSGDKFVLKAHNALLPSGTRGRLEAQNRLIIRLREKGIAVPNVVVAPSGENILPLKAGETGPGQPLIRMLTWLDGDIVPNDVPKDEQFLQGVGDIVGRVATALDGFEDKEQHWTWDWDMKRVHEVVRSKLNYITDEARRALASRLADEYADALGGGAADVLPHSVIHADLNDTNLLYKGTEVVGVLDFGDSIYSCSIFDPAISAGYYSLGQADPMKVLREVLRGYVKTQSTPPSEAELGAYFHAARGRILLSVASSAHYSSLEPDNEYLAHTAEPGWAVLQKLGPISTAEALADLKSVISTTAVGQLKRKIEEV